MLTSRSLKILILIGLILFGIIYNSGGARLRTSEPLPIRFRYWVDSPNEPFGYREKKLDGWWKSLGNVNEAELLHSLTSSMQLTYGSLILASSWFVFLKFQNSRAYICVV